MTNIDPVSLEHRLTSMEAHIDAGFGGIITRLDTLNGQVAVNTAVRVSHAQEHAIADATRRATIALRRRDWALLAGLLGAVEVLLGIAAKIMGYW